MCAERLLGLCVFFKKEEYAWGGADHRFEVAKARAVVFVFFFLFSSSLLSIQRTSTAFVVYMGRFKICLGSELYFVYTFTLHGIEYVDSVTSATGNPSAVDNVQLELTKGKHSGVYINSTFYTMADLKTNAVPLESTGALNLTHKINAT